MEDILELAAKLGKRIADDPRTRAFSKARKTLESNAEARQTIADYEQIQQKVTELQAGGKPIEPQDKHKLKDLHEKVIGNDVLKELLKTQADFLQLMTTVSETIESNALRQPPAS